MAANPQQSVWGFDWPYVRISPEPDAGRLCDVFLEWCGDVDFQRRVLVDSPARLYGFTGDA
jgi:2-pyrone-4,6-dicarboxylate lactonase